MNSTKRIVGDPNLHLYTNRRPFSEGGIRSSGPQIYFSSRITPGFIDLATYDDMETYIYTAPILNPNYVLDSKNKDKSELKTLKTPFLNNLFQKSIVPGIPLTMIPEKKELKLDFNKWTISYTDNKNIYHSAWLSITFPEVKLKDYLVSDYKIRWTDNLMHNLFKKITCGSIEYDNYSLDLNHFFYTDENKKSSYEKMIGNNSKASRTIPQMTLVLPLPYVHHFYHFQTRSWRDLLILEKSGSRQELKVEMLEKEPHLDKVDLFYNKIVTNQTKINKKPSLIESFETFISENPKMVILPFSGLVSKIYIIIREKSKPYESLSYEPLEKISSPLFNVLHPNLDDTEIKTDITLPSDYLFSIEPYFRAKNIPEQKGVYMFSCLKKEKFRDSYLKINYKSNVDVANLFVVVCVQKNLASK
jgi:hypothetical protein